jgi:xylulokinase
MGGPTAPHGSIIATHETALRLHFVGQGGVEQDTEEWWDGIRDGVRHLLGSGLAAADLLAVGVTGQYGSTVPVGPDRRAVGRCMVWADRRGGRHAKQAFGGPAVGYDPRIVVPWLRHTAGLPSTSGSDPSGHALWLRYADPRTYRAARWLLEPVDFIGMRLTGEVGATPASMVATWLTDNRPDRQVQPRYVPKLIELARREPGKLPPLLPSGGVLGSLSSEAAEELGLRVGVPVASGVTDLHAAHVGSGTLGHRRAHFAVSTTSWVSCALPFKKTDVLHQIASIPGLRPGEYLMIDNQETAGASLQWLRDGVLGPGAGLPEGWSPSYEGLVELAATSVPGAHGVMFLPWLKGERSPVDDLRLCAGFINLSLESTRADLVRAVLEGVAYNFRWLVESADTFAGERLTPLRILGGGARSTLWCQTYADVLDRRIERVQRPDVAQLRGVAFIALVATGNLRWDDVAERIPVDRAFDPDPGNRELHDERYAAFRGAHRSLKGWYHKLAR